MVGRVSTMGHPISSRLNKKIVERIFRQMEEAIKMVKKKSKEGRWQARDLVKLSLLGAMARYEHTLCVRERSAEIKNKPMFTLAPLDEQTNGNHKWYTDYMTRYILV